MIVPFYSFKGGVGRSMALANVARWFQMSGLNVRVIDWDLEAPGIDTFFFDDPQALEQVRGKIGLIDILRDYAARHEDLTLPPEDNDRLAALTKQLSAETLPFVDAPWPSPSGAAPLKKPGKLQFLGAGRRAGANFAAYAEAVQSFDWSELYAEKDGLNFFMWLREQLLKEADVVLIDSRTGVTEMGGIATRLLADVVVSLIAPNKQNLEGARGLAPSFELDPELAKAREDRALRLLPVPSRVDMSSELKDRFASEFSVFAGKYWPADLAGAPSQPWDLRIPYITKYAYEEQLAIGANGGDSDLQAAYKMLAAHIAWRADPKAKLFYLMHAEFERLFGADVTRRKSEAETRLLEALRQLGDAQKDMARSLLTRMVVIGDEGAADVSLRPIITATIDAAFDGTIETLFAHSIVRRTGSSKSMIALANEDYPRTGTMQGWLKEDYRFLQWRQRLATLLEAWQDRGREDGALLPPLHVPEATNWRNQRPPVDLFEVEREFIDQSVREAKRLRAMAEDAQRAEEERRRAESATEQVRQVEARLREVEARLTQKAEQEQGTFAGQIREAEQRLRETQAELASEQTNAKRKLRRLASILLVVSAGAVLVGGGAAYWIFYR
jgi:hypothetical protein